MSKGEVAVDIGLLLSLQRGNTTSFSVHTDQAPAIWINGNPAATDFITRQFAHDFLTLTAADPYQNNQTIPVLTYLADRQLLSMLHQVTGDPARTPSLVGFDYDDFYAGVGVAPGVKPVGVDSTTWADHVDTRATPALSCAGCL